MRGGRPPRARRDPRPAPAASALPARAVPALRPPQRPGGRRSGGRARGHPTCTQRLTEATDSPRGATAASPHVSDGAARRAGTFLWRPSPPRGANRHRRRRHRRAYRGREGGRERLTVLAPFTEQTTTLEGTAFPDPPARSATAHARAGPAPRARGRARRARRDREFFQPLPGDWEAGLLTNRL